VAEEALGGEVIPRSVLLTSLQSCPYLMCGMGDGSLLLWRADEAVQGGLAERKKVRGGSGLGGWAGWTEGQGCAASWRAVCAAGSRLDRVD
jgi:hypothetical protein